MAHLPNIYLDFFEVNFDWASLYILENKRNINDDKLEQISSKLS